MDDGDSYGWRWRWWVVMIGCCWMIKMKKLWRGAPRKKSCLNSDHDAWNTQISIFRRRHFLLCSEVYKKFRRMKNCHFFQVLIGVRMIGCRPFWEKFCSLGFPNETSRNDHWRPAWRRLYFRSEFNAYVTQDAVKWPTIVFRFCEEPLRIARIQTRHRGSQSLDSLKFMVHLTMFFRFLNLVRPQILSRAGLSIPSSCRPSYL